MGRYTGKKERGKYTIENTKENKIVEAYGNKTYDTLLV